MRGSTDVDYILSDCFLAVGQAVGPGKTLELETLSRAAPIRGVRYRHPACTPSGPTTVAGTAVGRHLGQRVAASSGSRSTIDRTTAERVSVEVERGCRLRASHASGSTAESTNGTLARLP